jgi:hypothetical protein
MPFDLHAYIGVHLAYEVKYLLVGATTWKALDREQTLSLDRRRPDVARLAMEAAYVHVRNLNEFFRRAEQWKTKPNTPPYSPHSKVASPLWAELGGAVHAKLLHPDPLKRPYQSTGERADQLMSMIVEFAEEAVDAWVTVSRQRQMEPYRQEMIQALNVAIEEASDAARWLGIEPLFAGAEQTT